MSNVRKIITVAMMLAVPCVAMAQNEWESPSKAAEKQESRKQQPVSDSDKKYLEGALPMVDGKIVFTVDEDVPGKSAQEIYDIVFAVVDSMTHAKNQFPESQIAIVNKAENIIAAKFREWLVFKSSALSIDRTIFNFVLIANCTDGHLNMTMSRLSYVYEADREGGGLTTSAEEWITDKYALNKSKTKLRRYAGKFRRKTIDRMEEIAQTVKNALKSANL